MGFIELIFLILARLFYAAVILFIVVFVGAGWWSGTGNLLEGIGVAGLMLATGWTWGRVMRAVDKLAGRP